MKDDGNRRSQEWLLGRVLRRFHPGRSQDWSRHSQLLPGLFLGPVWTNFCFNRVYSELFIKPQELSIKPQELFIKPLELCYNAAVLVPGTISKSPELSLNPETFSTPGPRTGSRTSADRKAGSSKTCNYPFLPNCQSKQEISR